ncbi:hypothetical protein HPP92_028323 [Vanilla planifolia]|uniref:Uncharacterized protein n=1 Tax=Vanilla planifolia TaxID=51239 RepID=A0A835P6I3_VANPL|nr:hypothetical protein HPP92_028323 [Vanilla planifolia]
MIKSEQEMHNQNLVFPLAFSQYTASEDTSSAVDEEEGAAVETSVESIDDGAIEEVNSAVHSNPPLESHQDQDELGRINDLQSV